MMITRKLTKLSAAIDEQSYEWMLSNYPQMLEAIEAEIAAGCTPDEIRRFVVRQTGRLEIALRCEQVARYVGRGEN